MLCVGNWRCVSAALSGATRCAGARRSTSFCASHRGINRLVRLAQAAKNGAQRSDGRGDIAAVMATVKPPRQSRTLAECRAARLARHGASAATYDMALLHRWRRLFSCAAPPAPRGAALRHNKALFALMRANIAAMPAPDRCATLFIAGTRRRHSAGTVASSTAAHRMCVSACFGMIRPLFWRNVDCG